MMNWCTKKMLPSWNISLFVQTCWEIMLRRILWILRHMSQLRALTRLYRCRIPMTAWQWTVAASSHIKQKSIEISAWHVLIEKFHDTWIKLDIIGYQLIIYSNLTLRCLQLLCNHTEHFYVDTVEPRWREWWSQVAWLMYDICLCRWYKGIR